MLALFTQIPFLFASLPPSFLLPLVLLSHSYTHLKTTMAAWGGVTNKQLGAEPHACVAEIATGGSKKKIKLTLQP